MTEWQTGLRTLDSDPVGMIRRTIDQKIDAEIGVRLDWRAELDVVGALADVHRVFGRGEIDVAVTGRAVLGGESEDSRRLRLDLDLDRTLPVDLQFSHRFLLDG